MSDSSSGDRYMTKEEVASWLRVSIRTVNRMARDGRLQAYGNGNIIRFRMSEVREFLQPIPAGGEDA